MNSLFKALSKAATSPSALSSLPGAVILSEMQPSNGGSGSVTVDKALQVSTVWACVRLIAETIATLPLAIYRRDSDGGRSVDRENNLHDIISSSPNETMTAVNFWEAVVASLLFRGNAYIEIHRIGERIVALDLLRPEAVRWNTEEKRWDYAASSGVRPLDRKSVMHIPAFSLDGVNGLSPIRYGAAVIGGALDADTAARGAFNRGLMPTVAFTVNRKLTKDQRESFREYVEDLSGSMNSGKSPVLEEGVDAKPIGIDPSDAQLLESRGWSVEEICRLYRVPPWMVGHTEKSTSWGTGIEQQMIGFLTFTLAPWLERIEQAINKNLLTPFERKGIYAEFAIEGLLRADSSARAEFYAKMTSNGIYTRDDCRARENLPRRGGNADALTVQMSMTTIDSIGQKTPEQQARAALMTWLTEE